MCLAAAGQGRMVAASVITVGRCKSAIRIIMGIGSISRRSANTVMQNLPHDHYRNGFVALRRMLKPGACRASPRSVLTFQALHDIRPPASGAISCNPAAFDTPSGDQTPGIGWSPPRSAQRDNDRAPAQRCAVRSWTSPNRRSRPWVKGR